MKRCTLIMVIASASLFSQQKTPASFMGVKFGLPLAKQMPPCKGDFLPNNSRCHDNGEYVRWKGEDDRSITVETSPAGAVWYVERDFPDDKQAEILDDLKARFGKPECDDHVSMYAYWGCEWHTSWGNVIFLWTPKHPGNNRENNIKISGGTNAYYAVIHAAKNAEIKRRRKDESF